MNIREVRRHGDGWGVFDPNASRASAVERLIPMQGGF